MVKLSEDNISGLIALIFGMVLFKVTTYFDGFETFLKNYKIWILIAMFIIYLNRAKIAKKIRR